jgi:hypothetical protein
MFCVALKDPKWVNSSRFELNDPMKKAIGDLQPQRTGDLNFCRFIDDQTKKSSPILSHILSPIEMFWFDSQFRDVKSAETEENLAKIKRLIESVIPILLFNEPFTKVSSGDSSMIDMLNTVFSFRLTGDTFKEFMTLFGIDFGEKICENPSSSTIPKDFIEAFTENVFPILGSVAGSKYRASLSDYKKANPAFSTILSSDEFLSVKRKLRDSVKIELVRELIQKALGLDPKILDQLQMISPSSVYTAVKRETNILQDSFFRSLFDSIKSGFSLNTFAASKARNERFHASRRFAESCQGGTSAGFTFSDLIVDSSTRSESEYQTIDELYIAIQELFKSNGVDYSLFTEAISSLPPTIMCCGELTPLFPQSEEEPMEFPEQHIRVFSDFLGNLVNEDMGGIGTFNEIAVSDNLISDYATIIGFGASDEVFSSDSYDTFVYLLEGLQFFLRDDVKAAVKAAVDQELP